MTVNGLPAEHARLLAILGEMETVLGAETPPSMDQFGRMLAAFKKLFTAHIAAEEEGKAMRRALKEAPHLGTMAAELQEQHPQLVEGLEDLVRMTGKGEDGASLEDLAGSFGQWLQSVRQHEMRENALLQEAYSRDLGA
ncbi:MAG: hemerythrin domain-containing protein [Acidobacteriota bacterium]